MPLGFSGGANLVAMGERYGDKLAQGIERGGAIIEQALQRVTTQRQLEGLSQTLSQIDPKTPDYTQKLMEVAPQFPFAMKDPRGQAIFSMGVQAHKQWEQGEQAKQMFTNQQTMQGIRQRDALALQQARGQQSENEMVDLTVPDRLTPQNPASGLAGVMAGAQENAPPPDETAQLMGMSGGLNDISARVKNDYRGLGVTKLPAKQLAQDVRQQRTFEQQAKMQEDRQSEAEKKAADKLAVDEKKAIEKEEADEKKFQRATDVQKRLILDSQLDTITREVSQHRSALNAHLRNPEQKDEAFYARKAELEGILQEAGERQKQITQRLDALGTEEKRFRYEGGKLVPK